MNNVIAKITLMVILSLTGIACTPAPTVLPGASTPVPPPPASAPAPSPAPSYTPPPVSTPAGTTPEATAVTADAAIEIIYNASFIKQADIGEVLIINIAVHNYGYESFDPDPDYFSVILRDKRYEHEASLTTLRTLAVPNGSKILGQLGFKVPEDASAQDVGFRLDYSGPKRYNIHWSQRDY